MPQPSPEAETFEVIDADVEHLDELPARQDGRPRLHLDPSLLNDELGSEPDAVDELLDELEGQTVPQTPAPPASPPASEPDQLAPSRPKSMRSAEPREEEIVLDSEADNPAFSAPAPPPPPPVPALDDDELAGDEDFWATVAERSDDDLPPSFSEEEEVAEEEPAVDIEDELEVEAPSEPPVDLEGLLAQDREDELDEEDDEDNQPYAVARRLIFSAEPFLSIISPNLSEDVSEINHVLSAFSELGPGQQAIVRADARVFPDYKPMASQWLAHRRNPEETNPLEKKGAGHSIFSWLTYGLKRLWFEANKPGNAPGGSEPPLAPGKKGGAKPLPLSLVSDEEKQAWNDAKTKARDSRHYEVDLRVCVIGKKGDADELERVCEESAAGFENYATEHQEFVAVPADGYDTLIGFMGARPNDIPSLTLSAGELGELVRVPDSTTTPLGVNVKHSVFRHLHLHNPITCDNPLNPGNNLIPLGLLNPNSDDKKVVCMRNEDLDKHWFHAGRTGTGKAVCITTPIATPSGFKQMGDLKTGDIVFDENGQETRITQAFEVLENRETFEVHFSDGSIIVADGEHQWTTETRATRRSLAERSGPSSTELPWADVIREAQLRDEFSEELADWVKASQLRDELPGVPRYAIWRAYDAVQKKEVTLTLEQSYGGNTVVKPRHVKLVRRGDMYSELLNLSKRTLSPQQQPVHEPTTTTTRDIRKTLKTKSGHLNHSIAIVSAPLSYPRAEQTIDPYLLGAWLGDGNSDGSRITSGDQSMIDEFEGMGYPSSIQRVNNHQVIVLKGLSRELRELNLLKNKHIPDNYLIADVEQRWALLQGLMDTDGGVSRKTGSCEFYSSNRHLARQVHELVCGLGIQARIREKESFLYGESHGPTWTVSFMAERTAFRLARKAELQKTDVSNRAKRRYITDVRPVESVPVRCIAVDSPNHLYLVGKSCIATHNSQMMLWMILGVAKAKDADGNPFPMVVIDPHGQLVKDTTRMLILRCPERIKDMVICDLGDADNHPVALNPLDVRSREEVESAVNSVMEMMARHMALGESAPRAKTYAQLALTALCEANVQIADPETKCTLLHVMDFFTDPTFRRLVCDICPNPSVRDSFDPERGQFELLSERQQVDISMPIVRAITPLKTSEGFGAVFSAGENKLDFTKLISQNKIVLVQLGRFQDTSGTGKLIGSLILPWLLGSMTKFGRREDERTGQTVGSGCRVFVDEGPTMLNPDSTEPLLAEARKYDVGLIIASQYIEQFPKSLVDAIKANTGSKLVLGLDKEPAKALVNSIDPEGKDVKPESIARLPNFHFYASVYQQEGKSHPFSAACLPMVVPHGTLLNSEEESLLDEVRRRSWAAICNDRDFMAEKRMRGNDDLKAALNHIWREKQARQPSGQETTELGIEDGSDAEWGGWGNV